MYYIAKVKFETVDDTTGRIKKIYEQYIVDAETISEAEEILNDRFRDSIAECAVASVQESKIMGIVTRR
jgi:predicted transcriptional regulator